MFFVEPACGKARQSCYNFGKMCLHVCVCPELSGHNPHIYAWISNLKRSAI